MKRTNQAYEAIRNDIIHCILLPGLQISQSQLVQRYEFGIASIREALQKLEQEGMVEAVPRAGFIIHPLSIADVFETYEIRIPLETTAVRLATLKGRDEQLENIVQLSDFTYDYGNSQSYSKYIERNAVFHRAIAEASLNQKLIVLISNLMDDMSRMLYFGLGLRDSGEHLRNEHLELATAIRDRQADEAEKIIRGQIENSRQLIVETLSSGNGNPLRIR